MVFSHYLFYHLHQCFSYCPKCPCEKHRTAVFLLTMKCGENKHQLRAQVRRNLHEIKLVSVSLINQIKQCISKLLVFCTNPNRYGALVHKTKAWGLVLYPMRVLYRAVLTDGAGGWKRSGICENIVLWWEHTNWEMYYAVGGLWKHFQDISKSFNHCQTATITLCCAQHQKRGSQYAVLDYSY